MKKILAISSVLALAACGSPPPPPQNFAPLDYSYLKPITMRVTNLSVVNNYTPTDDETQLNANNPAPPGATLLAMLNQRLQPDGEPGAATITVQSASINEAGGNINGQMTVDISLTSPVRRATGYTEASVAASQTAPDSNADMPAALYQMTKNLMDRMNVQLPYQIAHNIPSWVAWTSSPGAPLGAAALAPGGIQATPLSAPVPGVLISPAPVTGPVVPPTPEIIAPQTATPVMPIVPGTTTTTTTTTINPAVPSYLPGAGPTALTPPQ